MRLGQGSQIVT